MERLKACHCCGQIHEVPPLVEEANYASCVRCGSTISCRHHVARSASRTAAAALGAFALYWPAILLPVLKIERLGRHHQSSILGGTLELLHHGEWFVGLIVLLFSVVFPIVKIVMLLELSVLGLLHKHHRALTYRIMEHVGKWSMMDVLLLAFMVMLVKLGSLVEFQFGPAVVAFALCVAMSMLASSLFDPHTIWHDEVHSDA